MSGILCPYCTTPLHSTTSLPISPYLSNFTPCDPNLNLSAAAGAAVIFPTVGISTNISFSDTVFEEK